MAKTGSGKTLAFLVPAFISAKLREIQNEPRGWPQYGYAHPHILVVAPTRELAHQIWEEAVKFGEPAGLKSCEVFGGEGNSQGQKYALQDKNPHCVCKKIFFGGFNVEGGGMRVYLIALFSIHKPDERRPVERQTVF